MSIPRSYLSRWLVDQSKSCTNGHYLAWQHTLFCACCPLHTSLVQCWLCALGLSVPTAPMDFLVIIPYRTHVSFCVCVLLLLPSNVRFQHFEKAGPVGGNWVPESSLGAKFLTMETRFQPLPCQNAPVRAGWADCYRVYVNT